MSSKKPYPVFQVQNFWKAGLISLAFALTWYAIIFIALPNPLFDVSYSRAVLDKSGQLLDARVAADEQWRFPPGTEISPRFFQSLLLFEDRRFYFHGGIDNLAVIRALRSNIANGRIVSGASTITMQTIRLSRENPPRRLADKLYEAVLAVLLELRCTKDEILNLYTTHAPFGGNIVGVTAASWRYFNRAASELSWSEAAMLAVLPNNPANIHLERNREALKEKRDRLLSRLHTEGIISSDELRLSIAESIPSTLYELPHASPHLVVDERYWSAPGFLTTTLDRSIQRAGMSVLERYGRSLLQQGIHNAAGVIIHIETGEILGYFGNLPSELGDVEAPFVDLIQAPRSTGSLLKPFLYSAMIDSGELLPKELVADIPTNMGGYAPENHSHQYLGAVPANLALSESLNVPMARMLRSFGLDRFYQYLKDSGMSTLNRPVDDYGITLILGGAEGSLLNLTSMYMNVARKSMGLDALVSPALIGQGDESEELSIFPMSDGAAWMTLTALQDVVRPEGADWRMYDSEIPVAWKTGTSYGFRDAWAIGVNSEYAVGVWVGNAGGHGNADISGSRSAAPLMFELFNLLPGVKALAAPYASLDIVEVCQESGQLAGPYCEHTGYQQIPAGISLAGRLCEYHRQLHLDASQQYQVDASMYPVDQMETVNWFVLPEAMAWYYRKSNPLYLDTPPIHPDLSDHTQSHGVRLISPSDGAQVYIPVEVDGTPGQIVVQAAVPSENTRLFWYLDDAFLGETASFHTMEMRPGRGEHQIIVVMENGAQDSISLTVLSE